MRLARCGDDVNRWIREFLGLLEGFPILVEDLVLCVEIQVDQILMHGGRRGTIRIVRRKSLSSFQSIPAQSRPVQTSPVPPTARILGLSMDYPWRIRGCFLVFKVVFFFLPFGVLDGLFVSADVVEPVVYLDLFAIGWIDDLRLKHRIQEGIAVAYPSASDSEKALVECTAGAFVNGPCVEGAAQAKRVGGRYLKERG